MSDRIDKVPVEVTVNGRRYRREVEPRMLLVELIREELGLAGTHIGCETTYCGACTVLLNGASVKSCTVLAVQADQGEILTIEGVEQDGELHPVQKAFSERHALQCGYCTPGLIMSVIHLLSGNPSPDDKEIRKGIAGNVCRCTGYQNIIKAVKAAAEEGKKGGFPRSTAGRPGTAGG